jgi:hypothetical protein
MKDIVRVSRFAWTVSSFQFSEPDMLAADSLPCARICGAVASFPTESLLGYSCFETAGRFPIRISVACYVIGILGAYMFVTGIMAVVAPKSEKDAVDKE